MSLYSPVPRAGQPATKMFLTKQDLDATVYPEIVSLIARYSDAILNMNFNRAEGDLEAYLSGRYDIGTELARSGATRNKYLLSLSLDLAIYYIYTLQETIPAHRTKRYEQALVMLKMIQDGKSTLPGVDPAPVPDVLPAGQIAFGGNLPRATLNNPLRGIVNNSPLPSRTGYV